MKLSDFDCELKTDGCMVLIEYKSELIASPYELELAYDCEATDKAIQDELDEIESMILEDLEVFHDIQWLLTFYHTCIAYDDRVVSFDVVKSSFVPFVTYFTLSSLGEDILSHFLDSKNENYFIDYFSVDYSDFGDMVIYKGSISVDNPYGSYELIPVKNIFEHEYKLLRIEH